MRPLNWDRPARMAAIAGFGICLVALCFTKARVTQAYWMAWIFWSGIGFGSMALLFMHSLTGGAWGEAVRAPAEAAAMTVPVMGLLFLPALLGLGDIFPWVHAGSLAAHKRAYLQPGWFAVRGLGYFVALTGLTWGFGLWRRDAARRASPAVGAGGLVAYSVLMMFASTDWIMSLEPQWYSTMLVVIFAIAHILTALAFLIPVTIRLASPEAALPLHDLGNLLLAFVVFWAYVTFSQFLIIWSGNLPREIAWYEHRAVGGWPRVAILLALVQFAVPFALLLSRAAKQHARRLGPIAGLVFGASALGAWWLVTPTFQTAGVRFPFVELAALAGVGGLWWLAFLGFLRRKEAPHG